MCASGSLLATPVFDAAEYVVEASTRIHLGMHLLSGAVTGSTIDIASTLIASFGTAREVATNHFISTLIPQDHNEIALSA